jgi:signal transduction histidine kinase
VIAERIHSLTARFLLTLLLSTALPFVAFSWYARAQMTSRLEGQVVQVFLPDQAAAAAGEIEAGLRRIRQGCGTVVNQVREVLRRPEPAADFRMAVDFALEIDPDLVLLVDGEGKVIDSRLHPRFDRMTHDRRAALIPSSVADLPWYRRISEGEVWQGRHLSPFLHETPQKTSYDPADYSFAFSFAVPTAKPDAYGAVYWLMPWTEIQGVLDRAAKFLREEAGFASAEVFLCNEQGQYLAHTDRENYAQASLPPELLAALPRASASAECSFRTQDGEQRRAGLAGVQSYPSLQWWVGVHARTDELLATSRELGDVLLIVTAITALLLVGWSIVASRAILRPVRRLAQATEMVARGDLSVRVPARGRHELADLGRAFNRMAEDLERNGQQLRHAERQAAWGEMARQVAHEIKNPLTPMRMSAQLLLKAKREGDARLDELTDRLANTVLQQTDALSRIASEFRNFAGPPSRHLERIEIDELLTDIEQFFAAMTESRGVRLEFRRGAPGARVEIDRVELRRVFLNLIQNSFAACGERGTIAVSSESEADKVVVRVADDGSGIDAETRDKLFDPYFTTKSSGTGLGLAICRRTLEAYGGHIELESSRRGRTVFRFDLPLAGENGDSART